MTSIGTSNEVAEMEQLLAKSRISGTRYEQILQTFQAAIEERNRGSRRSRQAVTRTGHPSTARLTNHNAPQLPAGYDPAEVLRNRQETKATLDSVNQGIRQFDRATGGCFAGGDDE